MIPEYIVSTNMQKALKFLMLHPGKMCYEREIARGAKISYGSANRILNQLYKNKILQRKKEGRMCYYAVDMTNPYLKEFKILCNMLLIEPLIEKLKPYTRKVVLYGSWARGLDEETSDIDLFIVTSNKEKIRSIIDRYSRSSKLGHREIQAVINTPAELLSQDKREKVFREELEGGRVLWEMEINEDNL